jgi:hypothetical protein
MDNDDRLQQELNLELLYLEEKAKEQRTATANNKQELNETICLNEILKGWLK